MTAIPTLESDRLTLSPLDRSCFDAYERFYGNAEASGSYGGPLSPAAAWTRLASDVGVWTLQGFGVWAIRRRDETAVLGVCGFWQGRGWPTELTWWLLPEARGQGMALDASRLAVTHAYRDWGWPTVQTYMRDDNIAARKLVLRLGGGLVDRVCFPDGEFRDLFEIPDPAAMETTASLNNA
ncbi:GNAT family N-acetyltransferase [Roseateles chitinivorans]|uniref:GNAT family N-acetyltransferase n=1 Tax=Roseateles chitinivorans TaxID=2917965 RepID=UPI003D66EA7C